MEKLFSKEEIIEIETEAFVNLETYLDCFVMNGFSNEKSIVKISKVNKLIFVEGNSDTGYEHLRDRHSKFSFKNYWIETEVKTTKIDNPSKFHPWMKPIIDFIEIADTIFKEANKNITKNNNPDLFDKYTGFYNYSENEEKYHLLTYKNTKVVHTLFPDKKRYNSKRICKYGKGFVTTSLVFEKGLNDLVVPYENENKIVMYSILIRKFYHEKVERIFIQKHNDEGKIKELYLLGHRNFDDFEIFDRAEMNEFQCGNLTEFEEIIDQIDSQD